MLYWFLKWSSFSIRIFYSTDGFVGQICVENEKTECVSQYLGTFGEKISQVIAWHSYLEDYPVW